MSLTNHDFQWGRSEVVIIYPDISHRKSMFITIFPDQFDVQILKSSLWLGNVDVMLRWVWTNS